MWTHGRAPTRASEHVPKAFKATKSGGVANDANKPFSEPRLDILPEVIKHFFFIAPLPLDFFSLKILKNPGQTLVPRDSARPHAT